MKTQLLIGALAAALAIPAAYAQQAPTGQYVASATVQPVITRLQVKQEARQAEMSLQIPRGQQAWPDQAYTGPSNVARADIKAQARYAEAHHLIARGQQNFVSQYTAPQSDLSRAEVKADARAAEANHTIPRGESNVQY
jgi:hypothetical protein